jgi:predicted regulator of Ras-like GTPase activity (Roadblock/LC7/MglB family)
LPTIVDIPSDRIQKVSIAHADGETIAIEKSSRDLTDFSVLAVPEGRELSYATVGNGIAAALRTLELDDARRTADGDVATTTVFDTWDGLRVTATVSSENDESWVAFHAEELPIEADVDSSEDSDAVAATPSDRFESAGDINERLNGWQYRLPDHKTDLLVRRWDDILKSKEDGS